MEEIVRKLTNYMNTHNLKKYELAHKLGTTEASVSRWLSGKHKPSKAWTILIGQKLGK